MANSVLIIYRKSIEPWLTSRKERNIRTYNITSYSELGMASRVVTHLTYTELFSTYERNGLILPSSSLNSVAAIKAQIEGLLKPINPVEVVQFSSFLNMICQTYGTDMTMTRGVTLLKETRLVPANAGFVNRILFHRESLLGLIAFAIEKDLKGTNPLTGPGHLVSQQSYVNAMLLYNDLLLKAMEEGSLTPEERIMKDYFIREWPHYYERDIARQINYHRILRYRYCYGTLAPSLGEEKGKLTRSLVSKFEEEVGVSLEEYMHAITRLFGWFLDWPTLRENGRLSSDYKYGFDFKNINSFYIHASAFPNSDDFLKTIEHLSRDIVALKTAIEAERSNTRDRISGPNEFARVFFNNPIFKISDGQYCILDLKFVLENACGGLMWRVGAGENVQDLKAAYGHLMEEYFRFLIGSIFKDARIAFGDSGGADAIVEAEDTVLVFEFTTEYYRLASLYNETSTGFVDDAYRLLFNAGAGDRKGRGKKDRGKLIKLNDYVQSQQKSGKRVVPVLVTENLIGNRALWNVFGNFYDREIADKGLAELQKNEPLFLCLDDLEVFWSLFEPAAAVSGFADFAEDWTKKDKGPLFHNASAGRHAFVEGRNGEARVANDDYSKFFSNENMYGSDSRRSG